MVIYSLQRSLNSTARHLFAANEVKFQGIPMTSEDKVIDEDHTGHEDGSSWTIVIPVYNEEDYILATLQSLSQQSLTGARIIVVDNGSTDGSAKLIKAFSTETPSANIELLHEAEPGQAAALKKGIEATTSEFIAICDADTIYPQFYLKRASCIYKRGGEKTVAALAFSVPSSSGWANKAARLKGRAISALLRRQCHAGGYAHTFRTKTIKDVGGYDQALWPYCLKDHELVHRVSKKGELSYDFNFWCLPSDRREDRSDVRWTLFERIMYHATPHAKKDWFFYDFLMPRFKARSLSELKLRSRRWDKSS